MSYTDTTEQVIQATGTLDRVLSELVLLAKEAPTQLDEPDWQTLKHHAKGMVGAAELILSRYEGRPA